MRRKRRSRSESRSRTRSHLPDPGVYWYHPHIREDYGQEMGLYGNILVVPTDPDYWPPADRELLLTLDDVLIEDGKIATFSPSETTYVAMGRFGNVMLVSGEADLSLTASRGEVVRFFLTNTANTRVFNVTLPGARMKLVGADSGHYEREEYVDEVLIAPSERVVVDVLFDQPGDLALVHRTPQREYRLAGITVGEEAAESASAGTFETLRTNADMAAERERVESSLGRPADKTLAFVAEMDMGVPDGPVVYACPMHPEVVSDEPGSCPKCGMKLLAIASPSETTYVCPMHPEVTSDAPDRCPKCGMKLVPAGLVPEGGDEHGHEHHEGGHEDTSTTVASMSTTPRRASSGRTTWSRSTGSPLPPTCAGSSSIARRARRTPRSTGASASETRSRSASSTRWTQTTRCPIRSTSTGPVAS